MLTVQSVGFLFSDDPDSVVLAQSFDSNQDPNPNGIQIRATRAVTVKLHAVRWVWPYGHASGLV